MLSDIVESIIGAVYVDSNSSVEIAARVTIVLYILYGILLSDIVTFCVVHVGYKAAIGTDNRLGVGEKASDG